MTVELCGGVAAGPVRLADSLWRVRVGLDQTSPVNQTGKGEKYFHTLIFSDFNLCL